jgi:hypothetical protein
VAFICGAATFVFQYMCFKIQKSFEHINVHEEMSNILAREMQIKTPLDSLSPHAEWQ